MQTLDPAVALALKIDTLSVDDQIAYLAQHGDTIFQAVMTVFEPLLNEVEHQELSHFLSDDPEPEELLNFLAQRHEHFIAVLAGVVNDTQADES